MTVKEFALEQLHWIIRRDPWVQAIFLAAGGVLDDLAERIVAIYNFDNFDALTAGQCTYYERLLGLTSHPDSLAERRAAIQSAWLSDGPPTLQSIQNVCTQWAAEIIASVSGLLLILSMSSEVWQDLDVAGLEAAIRRIMPAHMALQLDAESTLEHQRMYVGTAGLFAGIATLGIAGDDPTDYTIDIDENDAYLIDENGVLLFE